MKTIADLTILVFVVSSLLSVGLSLTTSQIIAPLGRWQLVILSLVVNFIAVPLAAVWITRVLALGEPQAVGLILLGAAAGAPFFPKAVELAKGDVALSVGQMVLLMVGSLAYLPLVLPRLLPGVSVDSFGIARSMLVTMILPLGIGLAVRARSEPFAARVRPAMNRLSNLSMLIALVIVPAMNVRALGQFVGTAAIPAGALLVGIAFGMGYLLGGTAKETRQVLGFGAAMRNIPAALLIGGQNFDDPNVAIMVIVFALLLLFFLVPVAIAVGHRTAINTAERAGKFHGADSVNHDRYTGEDQGQE